MSNTPSFPPPVATSLEDIIVNRVYEQLLKENRLTDGPTIRAIVEDVIKSNKPQEIVRYVTALPTVTVETTVECEHPSFQKLLSFVRVNEPVFLHGPAGGGKTYGAELVSQVLALTFYRYINSNVTDSTSFFGYEDLNGNMRSGIAYNPFVNGGLFLNDEIDAGTPEGNLTSNALGDGRGAVFAVHGFKKPHPDFRYVATANTVGTGATLSYLGRNPIDKATLDRFVFVEWGYDTAFEHSVGLKVYHSYGGTDDELCRRIIVNIHACRKAAESLGFVDHLITPRAVVKGCKLLALGFTTKDIMEHVLKKSLTEDQALRMLASAKELIKEGKV